MTSIRDQAAAGGPEISLASDLPQQPAGVVQSADLRSANDLTPEGQFPEFGQFLEVVPEGDDDPVYWECPASLASTIVELVDEAGGAVEGAVVNVDEAVKTAEGEWRFVVAVEATE